MTLRCKISRPGFSGAAFAVSGPLPWPGRSAPAPEKGTLFRRLRRTANSGWHRPAWPGPFQPPRRGSPRRARGGYEGTYPLPPAAPTGRKRRLAPALSRRRPAPPPPASKIPPEARRITLRGTNNSAGPRGREGAPAPGAPTGEYPGRRCRPRGRRKRRLSAAFARLRRPARRRTVLKTDTGGRIAYNQGDWDNITEGTRQIGSSSSVERVYPCPDRNPAAKTQREPPPAAGQFPRPSRWQRLSSVEIASAGDPRLRIGELNEDQGRRLFNKNTGLCQPPQGSIESDTCPSVSRLNIRPWGPLRPARGAPRKGQGLGKV